MTALLSTAVGRLRLVSAIEGLSYVVLVGVAMPLKYAWGHPEAVRVVGMAHGVLFVAFVAALGGAWIRQRWSVGRAVAIFCWSLIPLGALAIERMLRVDVERPEAHGG